MNFTLTPGVYAALNLLSKATRSKVLEAAFAFVICGVRPTNLSKNLLVMFMMVVDSASEGKLTYIPEEEKPEEKPAEESTTANEQPQPEPEPTKPAEKKEQEAEIACPQADSTKEKTPLSGVKKTVVHHHRRKNRRHAASK